MVFGSASARCLTSAWRWRGDLGMEANTPARGLGLDRVLDKAPVQVPAHTH
jgi:hypothetical protein